MRPLADNSKRILADVIAAGRTSQADIARRLGINVKTLHLHLIRLRRQGLVTWEDGKPGTVRPQARRDEISKRCKAVDDLGRTFADNLNADALTDDRGSPGGRPQRRPRPHRESARILAIQREVRATRARTDPMGAHRGEATL